MYRDSTKSGLWVSSVVSGGSEAGVLTFHNPQARFLDPSNANEVPWGFQNYSF